MRRPLPRPSLAAAALGLACLCLPGLGLPAHAQTRPTLPPPTPEQAAAAGLTLPDLSDRYIPVPPADDSLYRALGADEGLRRLAAAFLERLMADARLKAYFEIAEPEQFRTQFALELCQVSGGPCQRKRNHRRIHSAMDIDRASFNAVVEVLQDTMDAQGIGFRTQNRLLALLAPMHRDIVNAEGPP